MQHSEKSIIIEMAESSDDIYFVFDPQALKFTYVNNAFEHFTRKSVDDLYRDPKLLLDLIHIEDRDYVKKHFNQLLQHKVNSTLDFRILRDDGAERWVRLKVNPIVNDSVVTSLSGILEDDTPRKLTLFNMQSVNSWKNSTLEILAHELTGPIGIVEELSKAISKKLPEDTRAEVRSWLSMIEEISKRNIDLIQAVIKRESLQTVAVDGNQERFELVSEIRQVVDIYRLSPLNGERTFIFTHSHAELYRRVEGMKYLQIVNNLLSNAIKFTGKDGQISVHLELLEETFLLTVADNGIGIPISLQPVLFHKYTPAGREGTDGQHSVGLGMWIIKRFVDAHQGRVWFETKEKVGTKFFVELPL